MLGHLRSVRVIVPKFHGSHRLAVQLILPQGHREILGSGQSVECPPSSLEDMS